MPRAIQFTEKDLLKEVRPGKRLHVRDTRGLYFDASPRFKGEVTGSWTHRYSKPDKSGVAEKSLGRYPEITLEIAKSRVRHSREIILRDKVNPYVQDPQVIEQKTFGEVALEYLNHNQKAWKNPKHFHDVEYMFCVHCKALTHRPIIAIMEKAIKDALMPLYERNPKHVWRVLQHLQGVFHLARGRRWYFAENPATKEKLMQQFPRLPKAEQKHHPAMPYADIPKLVARLRHRQQSLTTAAFALEFCILTGTRTGETLGMRWDEIDWDARVWKIPFGREKAKTSYNIPLSDRAITILNRQKEYRTCDYVFHGRKHNPLNERAMRKLLFRMGEPFTVHGFRSSFKDWITAVAKPEFWTGEMCLGHTLPPVQRAYDRGDRIEDRAVIMRAWSNFCLSEAA
jgi:integrase